ncbi:protein tramtrack, beta isoform-like isoform X3 [Bacillus rossius redtenbacheri]|uniref:protein tramtrack, beta isoform-like isoform X3 n=1 Tax=Bacillus rossius redtenbacheri TaxID=93214 RepID=UPI002FDEF477
MSSDQQFSLCWNDYVKHVKNAFDKLRCDGDLVDVTLSCEGKRIRAHKMLLSACSTYFKDLFKENPCQHPVIIFRNVKFEDLSALVDFMYQGEVNVSQDQLSSFLTTAEMLAVQGLSGGGGGKPGTAEDNQAEEIPPAAGIEPRAREAGAGVAPPVPHLSETRGCESPPASKRRKWGGDREPPHLDLKRGSEPAETVVPELLAGVKLERADYDEGSHDGGGYADSRSDMKAAAEADRDQLAAVNRLLGRDLEMYGTNSQDSIRQQPPDNMALDINQMLLKPGPSSGDNLSQDSLQGSASWLCGVDMAASPPVCCKTAEDGRQFVCKICGKVFRRQNSCYDHMALHQGSTRCAICQLVLSRKGNMRRHMKIVHGIAVDAEIVL